MLLTLTTKMTVGHTLDESIALAVRHGCGGIEIFGVPEHLPPDTACDEVVRCALVIRDLGLVVTALATYIGPYQDADAAELAKNLAAVRRYCSFADLLGCELIRQVPSRGGPERLTGDQWRRTADGLRAAADVAAEYEKRLVLETHDGQVTERPESTLRLLDMIGRENVGITLDPGNHIAHPGEWSREAIRGFAGRVWNVHVKDTRLDGRPALMGEGDIDYTGVWAGLADIGYDGAVGLESLLQPGDDLSLDELIAHEAAAIRASLAASPLAARQV